MDFWFGDSMDFDGTPPTEQVSYIPGVGVIADETDTSAQPFDRWAGQWGTGPEAYALHYDDPGPGFRGCTGSSRRPGRSIWSRREILRATIRRPSCAA